MEGDNSVWSLSSLTHLPVVYQLQLLSTWGDPYYVGLNGLQLFDGTGQQIPLTPNRIHLMCWCVSVRACVCVCVSTYMCVMHMSLANYVDMAAFPDSVNVLQGVDNDVRTPDKLIDGVNDTEEGSHMWLAPVLPGMVSTLHHTCMTFAQRPTHTHTHRHRHCPAGKMLASLQ